MYKHLVQHHCTCVHNSAQQQEKKHNAAACNSIMEWANNCACGKNHAHYAAAFSVYECHHVYQASVAGAPAS